MSYRSKGSLFSGSLDIVGDVHGEIDALSDLIRELGYSETGEHADGRRLVFVGDLVDLGPDSPAVLKLVMKMVKNERAKCVLGDHELNLLLGERSPDNSWWFDPKKAIAHSMAPVEESDRADFEQFLLGLPLALESSELRIVHACWDTQRIDDMVFQHQFTPVLEIYRHGEEKVRAHIGKPELVASLAKEIEQYGRLLVDPNWFPAFLPSIAEAYVTKQMGNTVRILTSGRVAPKVRPSWDGGKWCMAERIKWWDGYKDDRPVIVGHYWRRWSNESVSFCDKGHRDLLTGVSPRDWMGRRENVFCVDYSAGARERLRAQGLDVNAGRLAAVRIPEWQVVFDDGQGFELGPPKLTWA